jgi:hypothetical protein
METRRRLLVAAGGAGAAVVAAAAATRGGSEKSRNAAAPVQRSRGATSRTTDRFGLGDAGALAQPADAATVLAKLSPILRR